MKMSAVGSQPSAVAFSQEAEIDIIGIYADHNI
jgi:hypothetical protein